MLRIYFIVHEIFEGPGSLEQWAIQRGYDCSFCKIYLNEKLPKNIDSYDFLIVLGGPQRPSTTKKECSHFDALEEINVIRQFIEKGKAVLGVCLGAQLIGEALGASFEKSPFKEIGVFPILLTEEGQANGKFSHFPPDIAVGHWHGDMPGLTADAKIIAYSEGCPRQIIEYSELVYGFQCHLEFSPELIELLLSHSEEELNQLVDEKYVQSSMELRTNSFGKMNELLFVFLDKLVMTYTMKKNQR